MSTDSDGYLSFGVGLIFGMGIGAALGLLLTPKSGQALRSDIKHIAEDLPANLTHGLDDTKDKYYGVIEKTRFSLEKQINQLHEAFRAGKMAAAKKREELEDLNY